MFSEKHLFFFLHLIRFQNLEVFGNRAAAGEASRSAFALQKYCLRPIVLRYFQAQSFIFAYLMAFIVREEGFNLSNLFFSPFPLERARTRFMCPPLTSESGAEDRRVPPLFLSAAPACLATLFSQGHIPPCCVPLSPPLLCFFPLAE